MILDANGVATGQCVNECPNTFYGQDGECQPCNIDNCLTCQSPNYCVTCDAPNVLTLNNVMCTTDCGWGMYSDGTQCQWCPANCQDCTSATNCLNCEPYPNLYLYNYNGLCVEACPTGWVANNTIDCVECDAYTPDCADCAFRLWANGSWDLPCTTCNPGYVQLDGACQYGQCPDGTYIDPTVAVCHHCAANCSLCDSADFCNSCTAPLITEDGICYPPCADGTSFYNGACGPCPSDCANCTGPTSCTACNSGYLVSDGECYLQNTTCQLDIQGCEDCDATTGKCNQCYPGYQLLDGACQQCADNCQTCTSPTVCLTCAVGYFNNNGVCTQCSAYCYECVDQTHCFQCWTTYTLTTAGLCEQCNDPNCDYCDQTKKICYACANQYYVEDEDGECTECIEGCDTCNNAATCITCSDGYQLTAGICVNRCQTTIASLIQVKKNPLRKSQDVNL